MPVITWIRPDGSMGTSNSNRVISRIVNIARRQTGVYQCRASNVLSLSGKSDSTQDVVKSFTIDVLCKLSTHSVNSTSFQFQILISKYN